MKLLLKLFFDAVIFSLQLNKEANAQQLYVGTNYHRHDDKNIEKIKRDIQLIKNAGFKVVRMGHVAWDSHGNFTIPSNEPEFIKLK